MRQYFPFFQKYRKALLLAPLLVIADVIGEIFQTARMSDNHSALLKQKGRYYELYTGQFD